MKKIMLITLVLALGVSTIPVSASVADFITDDGVYQATDLSPGTEFQFIIDAAMTAPEAAEVAIVIWTEVAVVTEIPVNGVDTGELHRAGLQHVPKDITNSRQTTGNRPEIVRRE